MQWISALVPGSHTKGKPILSVLAKRTYVLGQGSAKPADEDAQLPLVDSDAYKIQDNPFYSDVTAESDYVCFKQSTDVVILAKAKAPEGKRALHIDCVAQVGPLKKTVRVFGDRRVSAKSFRGLEISDPQPFEERDIGYCFAYGGIATDKSGTPFTYLPNPLGKGFCFKGCFDDPSQIVLPNQEDPENPLTPDSLVLGSPDDWANGPKPCSFGWTRRNFYPRYTYAGVLPEFLPQANAAAEQAAKQAGQAKPPPIAQVDFRFYQGASDGLWGSRLKGGEPVRLEYMDRKHPVFQFNLPKEVPVITLDIGDGPVQLAAELDTVVIDKEKNLLTMLWRGSKEYGGVEKLQDLPLLKFEAK